MQWIYSLDDVDDDDDDTFWSQTANGATREWNGREIKANSSKIEKQALICIA